MSGKCIVCGKEWNFFPPLSFNFYKGKSFCSFKCKKKYVEKIKQKEKIMEMKEAQKEKEKDRVEDKKYLCNNCEYKWESKKKFGEPSICPNCKKNYIKKYSDTKEWEEEYDSDNGYSHIRIPSSANLKNDNFKFPCYCGANIQVSLKEMPIRGKKLKKVCSVCDLSCEIEVPEKNYFCSGCKKVFETIEDKIKHSDKCEKLKERIFNCSSCKEEFLLDDSELKELKQKKIIEIECPLCNENISIKKKKSVNAISIN